MCQDMLAKAQEPTGSRLGFNRTERMLVELDEMIRHHTAKAAELQAAKNILLAHPECLEAVTILRNL